LSLSRTRLRDRTADAVAGVHHNTNPAREAELRGDFLDVRSGHVGGGFTAGAPVQIAGFDHAADLLNGLAVNCAGA